MGITNTALFEFNNILEEEYSLVGQDGNAFSVMGYTARCMKKCGFKKADIDEMRKRAMSGDYDNLIVVCDDYIQKCNKINSDLDESFKLNEKNWNFTLKNGAALKNAIDDENYNEILQALYDCYSELKNNNIISEDDFYRYTGELDMYLNTGFDEDDDPEEILDYALTDLYDLCDNLNVWIPSTEYFDLDESLNESMYRGLKIYKDDNDLYCAKKGKIVVENNFKNIKSIKAAIDKELDTWGNDAYPVDDLTEGYHSFNWHGRVKISIHDNDPKWPDEYVCQVSEIHPYDDADYAWAKKDSPVSAKIIQNKKIIDTIQLPEWDDDSFEDENEYYNDVIDIMAHAIRQINKDVKSRIIHN